MARIFNTISQGWAWEGAETHAYTGFESASDAEGACRCHLEILFEKAAELLESGPGIDADSAFVDALVFANELGWPGTMDPEFMAWLESEYRPKTLAEKLYVARHRAIEVTSRLPIEPD